MLDRIKQYSTTEGTGAYTLGSAVPGFRTIDTAIAVDGHLGAAEPAVPYIATMGDDWEVGYGVYGRAGAGTLDRTVVASSNANSPVNWGAGSKEIGIGHLALGGINGARCMVSTSTPGTSNDIDEGYRPGSFWVQLDLVDPDGAPPAGFHLCLDSSPLAAVWINLKDLAGADLTVVGTLDMLKRSGKGLYIVNEPSTDTDPVTWPEAALAAYNEVASAAHMSARAGRQHDGGWTEEDFDDDRARFWLPRGAGVITGTVVACVDSNVAANNKGAAWRVEAVYRHDSSGNCAWIGTPTVTLIQGDSELSGVVVAMTAAPVALPAGFQIDVDGVALLNLAWSFDLRVNQVYDRSSAPV